MKVKPIVKHILSKELQLYYEKVTATIKAKQEEKVKAVLESIINDAGIHALVPYFAQFVSDEVTHNLKDLQLLTYLMYLVRAMLDSIHLHVEPYVQCLPCLADLLVTPAHAQYFDLLSWEETMRNTRRESLAIERLFS